MRASRVSNERGMALAVAIFALVVIGALVAGTFFAGRLEQQTGQNTFFAGQASEGAEAAMAQTFATLGSAPMLALATNGGSTALTTVSLGGNVYGTPSVTRLTSSVWLVSALGERRRPDGTKIAQRRLGQLVRLNQANVKVKAGLTAIGKVVVSGNSTVSGYDATPPDWTGVDCPTPDDVAGVLYNGQVTQQGSAVIKGDPNRQQDNTLTASNMMGGSDFSQLKAMATLTLSSSTISGLAPATTGTPARCDTSVENNWGAPTDKTSPCFTYFPIVYHYGDLSIQGNGSGQGILLVEGNLSVQGTIDFYGPVIVTGAVSIKGTGTDDVKFYGGVMAQDVTMDDSKLSGNAQVNYSSCAIRRALQGSAKPIPLSERSWVQLYN